EAQRKDLVDCQQRGRRGQHRHEETPGARECPVAGQLKSIRCGFCHKLSASVSRPLSESAFSLAASQAASNSRGLSGAPGRKAVQVSSNTCCRYRLACWVASASAVHTPISRK